MVPNVKQLLVLALGAVLLVLNFVFPFSSYPIKERSEDGRLHRSTVRWGFVPYWQVREMNEQATVKGNQFDDALIQWPVVVGLAVVVVVFTSVGVYRLAGRPEPPTPAEPAGR